MFSIIRIVYHILLRHIKSNGPINFMTFVDFRISTTPFHQQKKSLLMNIFHENIQCENQIYFVNFFRNIMKKNGTAVDVAIAVLVCNGAVHSHSLGLGGGFFMTIYIKAQFDQRVCIQSCSTGNKSFSYYVFCHNNFQYFNYHY